MSRGGGGGDASLIMLCHRILTRHRILASHKILTSNSALLFGACKLAKDSPKIRYCFHPPAFCTKKLATVIFSSQRK
jgi:hypothetical protein